MELWEQIQRRSMKLFSGVDHLPYKDRLRQWGLFSLEKRKLHGDPIATFQYLKERPTGKLERDTARKCSDGTRRNGLKLQE